MPPPPPFPSLPQEAGLFDFRRADTSPLLLLVDRLDDPLTPLLSQWTYQAMVHELLGIKANMVDLSHLDKLPEDQRHVPLSADADAFYRANMYENYGDLGVAVKAMVDEFQGMHQSTTSVQSIEDMLRFVENYPEFRAKSGTVSRHVSLLGEMSRLIDERGLMALAQLEQELATSSGGFDSSSAALESVMEYVNNRAVSTGRAAGAQRRAALEHGDGGDEWALADARANTLVLHPTFPALPPLSFPLTCPR